jgi:hypothetical protein
MGRSMFWKLFMNYGAIKIIVASQPIIITRNKDLMLFSHRCLDRVEILWRFMILEYEDACKISTQLDTPS